MIERSKRWLGGLAASLFGAALASLMAAGLDARYALARGATFFAIFASAMGLIAPLAIAVGLGVAALRVLLADGEGLSPRRALGMLRAAPADERSRYAALALCGAVAILLWFISLANLSAGLLAAAVAPPAAGAALSLSAVVLGWIFATIAQAGAGVLAPRFQAFRVEWIVAGAVLFVIATLGLSIATGSPGGTGGTLAIFGVFKRAELDLRGVGLVLLIALGAAAMVRPRGILAGALMALGALSPLALSARASAALSDRHVALAIERVAPLAKRALATARALTDRDRDGSSPRFGGGDCNDSDPAIGPDAIDVPGNGRDEDCSGGDEAPSVPKAVAATPAAERARLLATLPKNLSVVLISIDTLRADLGYMGYARPITPNLDALSKRSVVFERAYSLASYTAKSVGPMLLGKYSGETERGFSHFNRFPKSETFVQERLQKAGVFTLSVQGYWYFFRDAGLERGFDVIDSSAAPKVAKVEGDQTFNSHKISDAAVQQLSRPELANRRFFMWIHYVDPHSEYVRHEGLDFGPGARDRYDSEVAFVDREVGRVLEAIEKSPLRERTAIVVTSDHGEAFNEHGMIRHGFELWEELVRVPLMFQVPGATPRRITARRSAIDLTPTLLDLFDAPAATGQGSDFLSGESLLGDLFAADGQSPKERPIYVDMAAGPYNAERQAYIEGDLKLVMSGARALSLYDLKADPGEKTDLLDRVDLAKPLQARFKAFRSGLRPVRVDPKP